MTKLLIVQYGGNYRDAHRAIRGEGTQTYHAQGYVIDRMAALGRRIGETTLMTCVGQEAFDAELEPGLRTIGVGSPALDKARIVAAIDAYDPDLIVFAFCYKPLFQHAASRGNRTLVALADSFNGRRWIDRLRYAQMARVLNRPPIEFVANHGLNACLSLMRIGVKPAKVIPWDWPYVTTPRDHPARTLAAPPTGGRLVYVGSVVAAKGIGVLLDAVARLRAAGRPDIAVDIAGLGDIERFRGMADELGIGRQVHFLGSVPHDRIIPLMKEADAVVVPSQHDYPEGLPLTIYEALTARTPIIASDHPMFRGNVVDGQSGLIFAAPSGTDLAACVTRLLGDPELYARLSLNGEAAWSALQLPLKWADLVTMWVEGSPESMSTLSGYTIACGLYDDRLKALCRASGAAAGA